jgi:hypothetical protein
VPTSLADRFALLHWLANMDFFLQQAILAKNIICGGFVRSVIALSDEALHGKPGTQSRKLIFAKDYARFKMLVYPVRRVSNL